MGLLDLPTAAMIAITGAWLDSERERPLIECLSLAGPLLGKIKEVHSGLVQFQNAGKVEHPEVRALIAKTTALDADHDRLARGLHSMVSALVEISNPEAAEGYRSLLEQLFPTGLSINRQTYIVQAGEVDLREGRLTAESYRLLEATLVSTPEGPRSLRKLVDDWHQTARTLGEAEARKAQLKREDSDEISRAAARKAWARIISHFLATLDHEGALSAQNRARLLEPLESSLKKAALARAKAKTAGVVFDPEAPVEGDAS